VIENYGQVKKSLEAAPTSLVDLDNRQRCCPSVYAGFVTKARASSAAILVSQCPIFLAALAVLSGHAARQHFGSSSRIVESFDAQEVCVRGAVLKVVDRASRLLVYQVLPAPVQTRAWRYVPDILFS